MWDRFYYKSSNHFPKDTSRIVENKIQKKKKSREEERAQRESEINILEKENIEKQ